MPVAGGLAADGGEIVAFHQEEGGAAAAGGRSYYYYTARPLCRHPVPFSLPFLLYECRLDYLMRLQRQRRRRPASCGCGDAVIAVVETVRAAD